MANSYPFMFPYDRRAIEMQPPGMLESAGRAAANAFSDMVAPPRERQIPLEVLAAAHRAANRGLPSPAPAPAPAPAVEDSEPVNQTFGGIGATPDLGRRHFAEPTPDFQVDIPELKAPSTADVGTSLDKDMIDEVLGQGGRSVQSLKEIADDRWNSAYGANPAEAAKAMREGREIGQRQILNDQRLRQMAFKNTGGVIKGGPTDSSLDAEAARAAQKRAAQLAITTPAAPMGPVPSPASAPAGHFAGPRSAGDDSVMRAAWLNALGENADPEVPVAVLNPEVPLPGAEPTTKEGAMALRALAMRDSIKKINDLKRQQAGLPINEQTSMPIMSILPKPGAVRASVGGAENESAADRVAGLIGQKPTPVLNKNGLTGNQQLALDQEDAWDKFRQDRRDRTSGLQRWQNDAARANWQLARDRNTTEQDKIGAAAAAAASANALQAKQMEQQNNLALARLAQEKALAEAGMATAKEGMLYERRAKAVKTLADARAAAMQAEQEAQAAERASAGMNYGPEAEAAKAKRGFANLIKSQYEELSRALAVDMGLPATGVTAPASAQAGAPPATPATPAAPAAQPNKFLDAVSGALGAMFPGRAAGAPASGAGAPALPARHVQIMTRIAKEPGSNHDRATAYFQLNPDPTPEEFADLVGQVGRSAAEDARIYSAYSMPTHGIFSSDDPNRRPWILGGSLLGRLIEQSGN